MGTDSPLYINMLGEFTLRYGENVISDQEGRSKKLWLLIEYLVTFRGKEISQNDLIDLLWPDDSNGNPANTLKTLVHRARTMVAGLEYENTKNIIIYRLPRKAPGLLLLCSAKQYDAFHGKLRLPKSRKGV